MYQNGNGSPQHTSQGACHRQMNIIRKPIKSLASPRHERLRPFKHLSADTVTRLQRSLNVTARFLAPLSFKGS
jgi:hypothetical protein